MPGFDYQTITDLITCPKRIVEPPKKTMTLKNRSFRNDMKLVSFDEEKSFYVFMRISEDFPDDFSIGLIYSSPEGKIFLLFRCNGPHGECVSDFLEGETHFGYHEHMLVAGSNSMNASITDAYGTYQDAVVHFMGKCHIKDAESYFPFLKDSNRIQYELGI